MTILLHETRDSIQKRVRPVKPSKSVETYYRVNLRKHLKRIRKVMDQANSWPEITESRIESLIKSGSILIDSAIKEGGSAYNHANNMVKTGNKYNKKANQRMWKSSVGLSFARIMEKEGIDLILKGRLRENVSLIRSVSSEITQKTEDLLWRQFNGQDQESLKDGLSRIYRGADTRVRIIARDQTSKFNASLNEQRAKNLGIESYIWRTSNDERVRDTHANNDGESYSYDDPPSTGNPGDEVQCRCTAEPDVEKVLERLGI